MYDSDSEDVLPPGWQTDVVGENRVQFQNYLTGETRTRHPVDNGERFVLANLPEGWLKTVDQSGLPVFTNTSSGCTSFVDPRLALSLAKRYPHRPKYDVKFDGLSTASEVLEGCNVEGKYFIVLGGSRGVGRVVVQALSAKKAIVICLSRSTFRCVNEPPPPLFPSSSPVNGRVFWAHADLTKFSSLQQFAQVYLSLGWPVHGLILSAATLSGCDCSNSRLTAAASFVKRILGLDSVKNNKVSRAPRCGTEDGFGSVMQTNFIGHVLLLRLLLPRLHETDKSRIVFVSCEAHRASDIGEHVSDVYRLFSPSSCGSVGWSDRIRTYADSKLCQLLYTSALRQRLTRYHPNIDVFACSPGNLLHTDLVPFNIDWWWLRVLRWLAWPFVKSLESAAATVVYCAAHKDVVTDRQNADAFLYFNNCAPDALHESVTDRSIVSKIWNHVNTRLEEIFELPAF